MHAAPTAEGAGLRAKEQDVKQIMDRGLNPTFPDCCRQHHFIFPAQEVPDSVEDMANQELGVGLVVLQFHMDSRRPKSLWQKSS